MTPEQLAELKNDATLRKSLAKKIAHASLLGAYIAAPYKFKTLSIYQVK